MTTPKRGSGRPPGKNYIKIKALVTPPQLAKLDRLARRYEISRAAVIRQAVDELVGTVPVRGTAGVPTGDPSPDHLAAELVETVPVPAATRDLAALVQDLEARIAQIEARAKRK